MFFWAASDNAIPFFNVPINKMKVTLNFGRLLEIYHRLTAYYLARMEQGELRKQWTWEPFISDSLFLLFVDPNDSARQVGRHILEQVSGTRGLTSGLQFLCSSPSSLSALFLGVKHALKLVQLDSVLVNFQNLHNFFFVLCKLLKEGHSSTQSMPENSANISKFLSDGGFLRLQISSPSDSVGVHSSTVSHKSWEKFCLAVSEIAWFSIGKCLTKGKGFIDNKISQMTCIRLLETLPVVLERLCQNAAMMSENIADITWLHDLVAWGKSSLTVVVRYWKEALASLLVMIRTSFGNSSSSAIMDIEKLISHGDVKLDELTKQVARLSVYLRDGGPVAFKKTSMKLKSLSSEESLFGPNCSGGDVEPSMLKDKQMQIDTMALLNKERGHLIVLSDDEEEPANSIFKDMQSHRGTSHTMLGDGNVGPNDSEKDLSDDPLKEMVSDASVSPLEADHSDSGDLIIQKSQSCVTECRKKSASYVKHHSVVCVREESNMVNSLNDSFKCQDKSNLDVKPKTDKSVSNLRFLPPKSMSYISKDEKGVKQISETGDAILKDLVQDDEDDSWGFTFFRSAGQQPSFTKPSTFGHKRQVIQLNLSVGNRSGILRRDGGVKRFKCRRLDDWYRPILELDYFEIVQLTLGSEEKNKSFSRLKEVPVCFESSDQYVDIFRPLVLEEFKAQLNSSFQEMTSKREMSCGILSVLSIERVDDFHIVRCVHDDPDLSGSKGYVENDLILLTRHPFQSSSHEVHVMGKVERHEKDNKKQMSILAIRLYLPNRCPRVNRARKLLVERSKWYISWLMSITPQLREFQALSSIEEIPLLPAILNPVNRDNGHFKTKRNSLGKLSQSLQQVLKSSYNESQLQAISAAIGPFDSKKDFELCLIQGPPGTGKTRTIIAIVSGLLAFSQVKDSDGSPNCGPKTNDLNLTISRQKISQSAAIARAWQDAALARQLKEDVKNIKSMGSCTRGRVLICAQSNAAVDELVSRISTNGLYSCDGTKYKPYLVRVGNAKTVHPNSLPFFIDTLVDLRVAEERMNLHNPGCEASGESSTVLRSNLEKFVDQIRLYEAKRAALREGSSNSSSVLEGELEDDMKELSDAELGAKLRLLYEKKKAICMNLATAQQQEKKANEESRALRHKFRKAILKEAEIVVTTLSGCGGDLYGVCSESVSGHKFSSSSESVLFDAVVIDEAAQGLEPATLIPLQLLKSKGTRCIMVGDPKQLPATVLSAVASKYLFQCSMFERLQRAGHPVIMLTKQYRMHPEICLFPSLHFYESKLLNGEQMSSKFAPFHMTEGLGPYMFFDIEDGLEHHGENSGGLSLYNEGEANAAVEVMRFFRKRYPSEFSARRIGIITPYKCQLSLLRSRFSRAFGAAVISEMEFNTVDGFQGREVDVLLLSTVRAAEPCQEAPQSNPTGIGFVADVRRMNVALTRAKFSLWIFGNARTLQRNMNWAALLDNAKHRKLVLSVRRPYATIFKSAIEESPTLEKQVNLLKGSKHGEEVKAVSKRADLQKKVNDAGERKRKNTAVGAQTNHLVHEMNHTYGAMRHADKEKKGRGKDERDFISIREISLEPADIQIAKGKAAAGTVKDNSQTNCEHSENVSSKIFRPQKPVKSERYGECSEDGRMQQNIGKLPSDRIFKPIAGKGDRASKQVHVSKERKHQRDAVDALLSSALVSSKKPKSSLR